MPKAEIDLRLMQEDPPRYPGWIGDESSGWPNKDQSSEDEAEIAQPEGEYRGVVDIPAERDN